MRSIFAAMIMLSASAAVVHAGTVQNGTKIQPGYGYHMHMQAPVNRSATKAGKKIEEDNELLDLPPTKDEVIGANEVESEENAMGKMIEQENSRVDREVSGICRGC
jgi:hypothetical protein